MLWGDPKQRQGLHGLTGPSWDQFTTKNCFWLQDVVPGGMCVFGLPEPAINPWQHRGRELRNTWYPDSRKGYFFRKQWIIIWIKSDRGSNSMISPLVPPQVPIPPARSWGSMKWIAASTLHSSFPAVVTHQGQEGRKHLTGGQSQFQHQSCFSGFLQTQRHGLIHGLWLGLCFQTFCGTPKEETLLS